jgi:uncharacterized protein with PQ loop repeat
MNPNDPLPLAFVIVGTIASFILALSPVPLMYRIYKSHDVGFFKPDAFIVAVAFGIANGTYSMYSKQLVSFISTMITFVLYTVYLGMYTYYSKATRRSIYRKTLLVLIVAAFLTAVGPVVFRLVASSDSGDKWFADRGGVEKFIKTWLGVCATISVTLLLSGQVPAMIEVFKSKDARAISLEITLGALFASLAWMTYASLIMDPYFIISNSAGVFMGILSLSLKFKYRQAPINPSSTSVVTEDVPLESR